MALYALLPFDISYMHSLPLSLYLSISIPCPVLFTFVCVTHTLHCALSKPMSRALVPTILSLPSCPYHLVPTILCLPSCAYHLVSMFCWTGCAETGKVINRIMCIKIYINIYTYIFCQETQRQRYTQRGGKERKRERERERGGVCVGGKRETKRETKHKQNVLALLSANFKIHLQLCVLPIFLSFFLRN